MSDLPTAEMPPTPEPLDQPQTTTLPGAKRKAAVAFIMVTILLDMVALGIIIPVLPRLVEDFVGGAAQAGLWVGVFGMLWATMQFVSSPIQGALSDRFGRRPVILLSNFGMGLDYVLMALAPSLWLLLIGRMISGATSGSVSTGFAYIADVTAPEKRAGAFGFLGAAFGFGFIVGPLVGGVLGHIDPRLPFWAAAVLSLANAAYGFFVLPESLPKPKRMAFSWKRANPLGSLKLLRSHPEIAGLACVNFLEYFAHFALQTTFVLYAGHRYGWNTQMVGFALAGVGASAAIVQGVLTGFTVKRLGERTTLILALALGGVGFAIYGFAPWGWLFIVGIPVMALWGMAGPTAKSLMSHRVSVSEQGQLQGAVTSLASIAGIMAPLVWGSIYAAFNGPLKSLNLPGMAFLTGAVILFGASLLSWRVAREAKARPAEA
ncbi:MAG: TCR/Tet family MFS transporter [Caulobacteraceae bacterium]